MLDDDELARIGPIFWWSWRPGIKPLKALMVGGSLCLAALCIIGIGLLTLLPGPSAAGNPPGSLVLILLGLAMLAYPALLALWGYQDLIIELSQHKKRATLIGRIVGLRATLRRQARPGILPRGSTPWYGVALLPTGSGPQHVPHYRPLTLSVSEEVYRSAEKGMQVEVTYSPHLYYVYSLAPVDG